jgi:hypothetical protein
MKSKILRSESLTSYPCLKESQSDPGLVVLFTEPGIGTVVATPSPTWKLGERENEGNGWTQHGVRWCEHDFKPYAGKVELSNDDTLTLETLNRARDYLRKNALKGPYVYFAVDPSVHDDRTDVLQFFYMAGRGGGKSIFFHEMLKQRLRQDPPGRNTGETTRQMVRAPKGATFVWCNSHLHYPQHLARYLGRDDLKIVRPEWLERQLAGAAAAR